MVAVTDDGGARRLWTVLDAAPGDIRNCLVALSADESLLPSLFQHRFEGDGDCAATTSGTCSPRHVRDWDFAGCTRARATCRDPVASSVDDGEYILVVALEDGHAFGEINISRADARIRRVS
jgi:2-phospho-L-lactate transferase/gluconeogenesis factor (CofD/UPF0052 family)